MKTNQEHIQNALAKIAPAWPLKNLVAVNPYLGFTSHSLQESTQLLNHIHGVKTTMKLEYYLKLFRNRKIEYEAIDKALQLNDVNCSVLEFIQQCDNSIHQESQIKQEGIKSVADLATTLTGTNWNEFLQNKTSSWAASYFDEFQASWNFVEKQCSLYTSWRNEVKHDRSYKIIGLKNYAQHIANLPQDEQEAIDRILADLSLNENFLELYATRLLYDLIGWSSYFAGLDWNNGLYSAKTKQLNSFLTILLASEFALYKSLESEELADNWKRAQNVKLEENNRLKFQCIFQDALDLTYQAHLGRVLKNSKKSGADLRPKLQAAFCIDVRSEVIRRHLEQQDVRFETKGYAGFFGVPIKYAPLGAENRKNLCPVLLPAGPLVKESAHDSKKVEQKRIRGHQLFRSFKAFKSGPVSSFGFVSPLGLAYLPKLIGDTLGYSRPVMQADKLGHTRKSWLSRSINLSEIDFETKLSMAEGTLTSMGFNDCFAPIILLTGHGSSSVNNPHGAGLECGACGGHAGDINARTASKILNEIEVRTALRKKGISIPEDTIFVPCLHNTTTDEIEILDRSMLGEKSQQLLQEIEEKLGLASEAARLERSTRLAIQSKDVSQSIFRRSKDWSQIRPEWGLAGCSAFIIAERANTREVNLEGKAFLHDYNWKTDENSKLLESIMTAPMVVTSWINLQYYGSTVDPTHFGAGNKTLHNVTAGIGVIEGCNGDLRIGLPLQSIHNGKDFEHFPQRLSVVIQAPTEQINKVLRMHQTVRDLFDNKWIHLLSMQDNGKLSSRYLGNLNWELNTPEDAMTTEMSKNLITI